MNVVFFMEEVQKYDGLYNKYSKSYKSYKDKYIKINCWTKIGEKFVMSAADAGKKIKNVRTGCRRYLKKVNCHCLIGPGRVERWGSADSLETFITF